MKPTIAVLALLAMLVACGSESGEGDTAGRDQSDGSTTPTAEPTGPPWPAFPHDDYSFVYSRVCRCIDGGMRIRVTVVDDRPVAAVYADDGRGVQAGDPADQEWQLITLDDVIDHANTADAAEVAVEWPTGLDYPDSVWVDPDERTADEEIGFTVHGVSTG